MTGKRTLIYDSTKDPNSLDETKAEGTKVSGSDKPNPVASKTSTEAKVTIKLTNSREQAGGLSHLSDDALDSLLKIGSPQAAQDSGSDDTLPSSKEDEGEDSDDDEALRDDASAPAFILERNDPEENNTYIDLLQEYAQRDMYSNLVGLIEIHRDQLDGIESSFELDESKEKYPTGVALVRRVGKETMPKFIDRAISTALTEADNMLLRTLNTLRGIDRVLEFKGFENQRNELEALLLNHINNIIIFRKQLSPETKKNLAQLKRLEANFNSELGNILHKTGLDQGINKKNAKEEFSELLLAYRLLACTHDPAKTLVTITTKEVKAEDSKSIEVTVKETAHPVTKKTEKQKAQLAVMKAVNTTPDEKQKNFHTLKPFAFQVAEAAHADLIASDDRMSAAQMRKSIGPTTKNTYVVHTEIESKAPGEEPKKSDHWIVRSGAMVYIGKEGEGDDSAAYTAENIQQIRETVKQITGHNPEPHLVTLLTDDIGGFIPSGENQHKMIKGMQATGLPFTKVPMNVFGLTQQVSIAPEIKQKSKQDTQAMPSESRHLTRATRTEAAGQAVIQTCFITPTTSDKAKEAKDKEKQHITLAFCASGQDRTGTAVEMATQLAILQHLSQYGTFELKNIISLRVGYHNAVLATFCVEGSLGLKPESAPSADIFLDVTRLLYRESANSNKKAPINEGSLKRFLALPQTVFLHEQGSRLRKMTLASPKEGEEVKVTLSEAKITESHIDWIKQQVNFIVDEYKSSGHKDHKEISDLPNLIGGTTGAPQDQFKEIVDILKGAWEKNLKDWASRQKIKFDPSSAEDLKRIGILRIKDLNSKKMNKSTSTRNIGALLQCIASAFPLYDIKFPSERINSDNFITTAVPKTEIEELIKNIKEFLEKECKEHPDLRTEVSPILKALEDKHVIIEDKKVLKGHDYILDLNNLINKLNAAWEKAENAQPKKLLFTISLLKSLEKPGKSYERGLATILKQIHSIYPNSVNTKIDKALSSAWAYKFEQAKAADKTQQLVASRKTLGGSGSSGGS